MTESEDLRAFIREITLRFERGMERIATRMEADLQVHREESRRYFERLEVEHRARHEESRERLDEILAEGRAGRQALFRMLDKLDGGGAAPAG